MILAKTIVGYLAVVLSAGAFIRLRALLVPFIEGDSEVISTLSISITLCLLAVCAGATGAFLLIPERYLATITGLVLLLTAGPTLLGSVLDLTDYLSDSGYAGFGTRIMILVGNSVLLVGVGVLALIAAGPIIRLWRSQKTPVTPVG